MKVTKVNQLRSVVTKKVEWGNGRGNLYTTSKNDFDGLQLEKQVIKRVDEANCLYNVFFKADNTRRLENCFAQMVSYMAKAKGSVNNKRKYMAKYRINADSLKGIKKFSHTSSGTKTLEQVLTLHVHERMTKEWYEENALNAAVQVLACMCNRKIFANSRNYKNWVFKLDSNTLNAFCKACENCSRNNTGCPQVYIGENSRNFEECFTLIMKDMVKLCEYKETTEKSEKISIHNPYYTGDKKEIDQCIENQIDWLCTIDHVSTETGSKSNQKTEKTIVLKDITFPHEDERMKAILVRMRRALKRGSNRNIAIRLLQALASGEETPFASLVAEMREDSVNYEKLKKFIDAVNRDYYKPEIIVSINRNDTKVQPAVVNTEEEAGDLSLLNLSNAGHEKKAALNDTLLKYASSAKDADNVLLTMKALLFEYFPTKTDAKEYLTPKSIWSFPNITENSDLLFDDGFQPEGNDSKQQMPALQDICRETPLKKSAVKARIRYVNGGKYQQLIKKDPENAFRNYWLRYMENYVERYFQKKATISKEDCRSDKLMISCWKDMIQYLCGKYTDIGKAVYHFVIPENLTDQKNAAISYGEIQSRFKEGVSSFDYERIKAEENLQRDISNAVMAATATFSRSVINDEDRKKLEIELTKKAEGKAKKQNKKNPEPVHLEDILLFKEDEIKLTKKPDAKKLLLRFYGGDSSVPETIWTNPNAEMEFILELKEHLTSIRNENFHYTPGKHRELNTTYADRLWENDKKAYADIVRKRYYSNNAALFYDENQIINLVTELYKQTAVAEAQIPAFRSIWKRADLPDFINTEISADFLAEPQKRVVYEGTLYFLLKEIYYHDFIVDEDAKIYLPDIKQVTNSNQKSFDNHKRAEDNFSCFIDPLLKDNKITFGGICQAVQQEYNRQNTYQTDQEIYKHFKILLPAYVKKAFIQYIKKYYANWLLHPSDRTITNETYLDQATILDPDNVQKETQKKECNLNPEYANWYTFAHFLHPRQLNLLVGDFKTYIQYTSDIVKREDRSGQLKGTAGEDTRNALCENIERADNILQVLDFVRGVSGRISAEFEDYYESKEAYARFMNQYIDFEWKEGKSAFESLVDFCKYTLPNGDIVDIYADEKNPKLLRNIEIARMYAGGDVPFTDTFGEKIRRKINAEEIRKYYRQKDEVAEILSQGLCKTKEEQQKVVRQQQLKNRLTLNDVTDIYAIINDLLGQLIGLAYLRERDEMYLYLGFYYMALRSSENWAGEYLDIMNDPKKPLIVNKGLALYQIIAVYNYGTSLPYPSNVSDGKITKWAYAEGALGTKYLRFAIKAHKTSFAYARRLFGEDKRLDTAVSLRNYVDHAYYYAKHDKSIMDLYSEFYDFFFSYSRKLRNSVAHNFQTLLERYFVDCVLTYAQDDVTVTPNDPEKPVLIKKSVLKLNKKKFKSMQFTYKLEEDKTKGHSTLCLCDARSKDFIDELFASLEYKQTVPEEPNETDKNSLQI